MKITEIPPQTAVDAVGEPTPAKMMAAPAPGFPESRLRSGATAHALAITELRRLLAAWHRHEGPARLAQDPEDLHQLRVTTRRIDATLALFKDHVPERLGRARKTAKGVLRALGAARDVDVQLAELTRYCAGLPEEERVAAVPLTKQLQMQGARAHERMVRLLDAAPTRRWLEDLSMATAAGATVNAPAQNALVVMPQRVRQRFRKLRKTVRKLPTNASMDEFHEVRRRAKQLRYAIECASGMFGKPADEFLKALRRMQEKLGVHQDAHVARSRLATLAADSTGELPAATLFLMGRLAERQSDVIARAGKTLSRSWRRVRGKRWKAMRARLGELSDRAAAPKRIRPRTRVVRAAAIPANGPAPAEVATAGDALAASTAGSESKH